jgi:hypothetical protein
MQHEGEVRLRLGGQHAGRSKAVVVDERGVIAAFPLHGIGWIGDDGIEGLVAKEVGIGEGVAQLDVELVVVHVVQEHVHPRQVVGGVVDFLPEEPFLDDVGVEVLLGLEQQGAGTGGGVVDLVDAGLPLCMASCAISLETCCGVKNSPPDFPALAA